MLLVVHEASLIPVAREAVLIYAMAVLHAFLVVAFESRAVHESEDGFAVWLVALPITLDDISARKSKLPAAVRLASPVLPLEPTTIGICGGEWK